MRVKPVTVAVVVVKTPKMFHFLGHMPVLNWSLTQLLEARGIDRIECVAAGPVLARTRTLLAGGGVDVRELPAAVAKADDRTLDAWLTAADGPAFDADTLLVTRGTCPYLPAGKIEACVAAVRRKKVTACMPARETPVVAGGRRTKLPEPVDGLRVVAVRPPAEPGMKIGTVPVSLIESLDVDTPDEFVLVEALADSGKV